MIILRTAAALENQIRKLKDNSCKTGFVPTMGAIHEGHLALVKTCKQKTDFTICSIFVNPTQFNDPKDFEKYPRTTEQDILLLELAGTDLLFLPPVAEIYPAGNEVQEFTIGYLETILEGYFRPGHFYGVWQVMLRLLEMVKPDELFMGAKDWQQCLIVQKLITDHRLATKLNILPTIREEDGLALSSRNKRLNAAEKNYATNLYKALTTIKEELFKKSLPALLEETAQQLLHTGFSSVDYLVVCNAATLEQIKTPDKDVRMIALAAAYMGDVRLIDNLIVHDPAW